MNTHMFHRSSRAVPPMAAGGAGIELIGADGRRYIDASGGAAVSCLGHGHRVVTRAIVAQAERLAYAHTSFFTNQPAERLAEILAGATAGRLNHVYFVD